MIQQPMLEKLQQLLHYKKSKAFYAKKLNVSIKEIDSLLSQLRTGNMETGNAEDAAGEQASLRHNLDNGTLEVSSFYETPPTPEQIIADHQINLEEWKLSSFWSKQKHNGYYVSALFAKLPKKEDFSNKFTEFISTFKSSHKVIKTTAKSDIAKRDACLILNMQDAHYNKHDVDGSNSIEDRFENDQYYIQKILNKAFITSNLTKIIYVIGSDAFNSEWTGTTTKGTPQFNVSSYQEGFADICQHQVDMINNLLAYSSEVEVMYMPGNHDEYAGWHMVNWLKAYYKEQENLSIDDTPDYTKYRRFSNTAMQFNHGDAIKPEKLAGMFPMEFKNEWSLCDNYYIFTGDKHHLLAKDFYGIQFYQLPQLSKSNSLWDKKNGYTTTRAEMVAFLIEDEVGVTDIYKELI